MREEPGLKEEINQLCETMRRGRKKKIANNQSLTSDRCIEPPLGAESIACTGPTRGLYVSRGD
jgi:hypothetical protein